MKTNNEDLDFLTLYVKKNKVEQITKHYQDFGWNLNSKYENDKYEDIEDLTFSRSHKIINKDELQLQQVYLEEKLNELGKAEKFKHSKSTALGLCFGVPILGLLVLSVLGFINLVSLWISVSLGILGVILMVIEFVVLPKVIKKETKDFLKKSSALNNRIEEICALARVLTGGKNEENK